MNPAPSGMHYVYLLKSGRSNWLYIGVTSDLKKRLDEHFSGKSFSTKRYLPVKLVYYEAYTSAADAFKREKMLKHYGNSLGLLKKRIKNSLVKEGAG